MLNRYPPPSRSSHADLSARGECVPLEVEIGGWTYRFEGLDAPLRQILETRYEAFAAGSGGGGCFRVRVLDGKVEHFVPPQSLAEEAPHPLSLGWEADALLVRSYGFTGWISVRDGEGEIALARGEYEKGPWSVENYLRVCTAWRAVSEGGALLHAASVVRSGKCHIFMGASGSGKSTLAAISRQGRVVSDDLTLVRKLPEGFRVAGTPFRGTYSGGEALKGLFPIAGVYRIFKAASNRLEPCPERNAVADLLASCPFVVDQLSRSPEVLDHLRVLNSVHPLAYLHFNLQGDFWDVLPGD